jgi:acyl-coenzyme A thioesterase PaaI-like protein
MRATEKETAMTVVPTGFVMMKETDGFIGHVGPYYMRREADGSTTFGFQSDQRHVNMNGVFHGGALLSFLDTILGYVVVQARKSSCATVAFESKFVAGVAPGGWITGRVRIRALTRTLAFTEAEALDGDTLLVTASGVFRMFEPRQGLQPGAGKPT